MQLHTIAIIAQKELRDALRNRWLWLYTIAFAGLALGIRRVGTDGIITTAAGIDPCPPGTPGTNTCAPDGTPATSACLVFVRYVSSDARGTIYLSTEACGVYRLGADGKLYRVAGGNKSCGYSGDGGLATDALLCNTAKVASSPDGNLLIADRYDYRIRKVGTDGIIKTVAGNGTAGGGGDGGPATQAQLNNERRAMAPWGVRVGPDGSLYIADTMNHHHRARAASHRSWRGRDLTVVPRENAAEASAQRREVREHRDEYE